MLNASFAKARRGGLLLVALATGFLSLSGGCGKGGSTQVAPPPFGSPCFAAAYTDVARAQTMEQRWAASRDIALAELSMCEEGLLLYILMDVALSPKELERSVADIAGPEVIGEAYSEMWDFPSGVHVDILLQIERNEDGTSDYDPFDPAFAPPRELRRVQWYCYKDAAHPEGATSVRVPQDHLVTGETAVSEPARHVAAWRADAFLGLYMRSLAAGTDGQKEAVASELEFYGFPPEEEAWLRWTLIDVGMNTALAHKLAGGDSALVRISDRDDGRLYSTGLRLLAGEGAEGVVREAGLCFDKRPPADSKGETAEGNTEGEQGAESTESAQ